MLTEDTAVTKESNWNPETEAFNKIPWDYFPPTFYTAENLQIKSGGRAIIMAGSDNVVRNNTIEVDGRTAVYLYGPRSLVEGNTFIVHMDPRDKAPLPAILKLRDADGSIIRNNRFIVKRSGLFRKKKRNPRPASTCWSPKGVVIEGNVFEQVALPVRKDAA
ncbi:right-handed parallel beta-helix repeat-containing protein, partial [Delftia sp.]|uniref:right-handed parallel beta-helix repeat-containing protein n=1 Tax=Delftia sp. TaxID=1886637 RepID=UPI00259C816F